MERQDDLPSGVAASVPSSPGLDPDMPITLQEAAETLLRGLVTASTLRAAIARNELSYERLGRRYVVTPRDIKEWRERNCSRGNGGHEDDGI